jgi:hypothetical protein
MEPDIYFKEMNKYASGYPSDRRLGYVGENGTSQFGENGGEYPCKTICMTHQNKGNISEWVYDLEGSRSSVTMMWAYIQL